MELSHPVEDDVFGHDQQASVVRKMMVVCMKEGDGLQGFAQAHAVSQDAALLFWLLITLFIAFCLVITVCNLQEGAQPYVHVQQRQDVAIGAELYFTA